MKTFDIIEKKKNKTVRCIAKDEDYDSDNIQLLRQKATFYNILDASGDKIWLESDYVDIKYNYQRNEYKTGDVEGYMTVNLDAVTSPKINKIEDKLLDIFLDTYSNEIIGSLMLTGDTIRSMFNRSLKDDSSIKLKINKNNCVVFDDNNQEIQDFDYNSLRSGAYQLNVVVEIDFIWIMNNNIGTTWNTRQIKISPALKDPDVDISSTDTETNKEWSLDGDSSSSNVPIKRKKAIVEKAWSLKSDSSGNEKFATTLKHVKKKVSTWSLKSDSSGGAKVATTPKKKVLKKSTKETTWSLKSDSSSGDSKVVKSQKYVKKKVSGLKKYTKENTWSLKSDSD
jgi:hypothetical protein